MQAKDIMTPDPACCTPGTPLPDVARLMVEHDCGEIPVVEGNSKRPVGVVTDRDITCRTVAQGKDPMDLITAKDCMSAPVVTVTPDTDVDECCHVLEENQIRRVPVVDEQRGCCGMVSQADIARGAPEQKAGEVVRDVSQPTDSPSRARGCC